MTTQLGDAQTSDVLLQLVWCRLGGPGGILGVASLGLAYGVWVGLGMHWRGP